MEQSMQENTTDPGTAGKTTIASEVLLTIVRFSAISVEGVAGLAPVRGGLGRLARRGDGGGVRAEVEDGVVYLDIFLILQQDVNAREVSRQVQQQVSRAITEMLSMEIGHVNIHIENIQFD